PINVCRGAGATPRCPLGSAAPGRGASAVAPRESVVARGRPEVRVSAPTRGGAPVGVAAELFGENRVVATRWVRAADGPPTAAVEEEVGGTEGRGQLGQVGRRLAEAHCQRPLPVFEERDVVGGGFRGVIVVR